jgi:hypothetical protein
MKRTLLIVTVAAGLGLAACNSKTESAADAGKLIIADTTGLAAFQDWKAENERLDANKYYMAAQPVAAAPVKKVVRKSTPKPAATQSGTMNSSTTNEAKKKGLSKAAKGAIIGGVTGAAAGAIINKKNRVVGGVIGGVLGGGVGYGIGRGMDKKDGRY